MAEERVMERAPAYIKLDSWSPLFACYGVFGDVDDLTSLWENLEGFDAATGAWIERKSYSLVEHEPFGFVFVHVLRWRQENAIQAFENYARRLEWEHHGYMDLKDEIMAEVFDGEE